CAIFCLAAIFAAFILASRSAPAAALLSAAFTTLVALSKPANNSAATATIAKCRFFISISLCERLLAIGTKARFSVTRCSQEAAPFGHGALAQRLPESRQLRSSAGPELAAKRRE